MAWIQINKNSMNVWYFFVYTKMCVCVCVQVFDQTNEKALLSSFFIFLPDELFRCILFVKKGVNLKILFAIFFWFWFLNFCVTPIFFADSELIRNSFWISWTWNLKISRMWMLQKNQTRPRCLCSFSLYLLYPFHLMYAIWFYGGVPNHIECT